MFLCVYASKGLSSSIMGKNDSYELPIRVNVEEKGYSFSTSITGYVKYMSQIENIEKYPEKAYYTFTYIAYAWINLIIVTLMYMRMIGLWGLSLIGPAMSVLYLANYEGRLNFKKWAKLYIVLSLLQVWFILIYKIIMANYI